MSTNISVVIPTFNSSALLAKCLESVSWADEIIVVDMGSTDETVNIAKKYGAVVIHNTPADGNFDKNRELGMRKAKSEWILKLDTDEELTSELQKEIREFLVSDDGRYNGFFLRNRVFMFGHQIKHGFIKRDSKEMRMVRKNTWKYDPYKFHEQIKVSGLVGTLKNSYNHYNFRTISEFLKKTNKYTDLDSAVLANKHYKCPLIIIISIPWLFFKFYVLQQGFLDGKIGIEVSFLFSLYYLIERIKIWELKN